MWSSPLPIVADLVLHAQAWGHLDFEVQQWKLDILRHLGLAVSPVKKPRLYQGQVEHMEHDAVVLFLGPDLGAIEGDQKIQKIHSPHALIVDCYYIGAWDTDHLFVFYVLS